MFIHHGAGDPVIEVGFGRRAATLLEADGLDVEYVETDAGHWIPPPVVAKAAALVARVSGGSPS